MTKIIIANIICFIAYIIWLNKIKSVTKSEILKVSAEVNIIYTIANLLLGGIVGAMINIITVVIRYLEYKEYKRKNIAQYVLITVVIIIAVCSVNDYIQYITIIAFLFIAVTNKFKTIIVRTGELCNAMCYILYDFHMKNYVDSILGIISVVLLIMAIYRIHNGKEEKINLV